MTEKEMRERLDNGLCIKCGKPILDKRGICQKCYERLPQSDKILIILLSEAFRINGDYYDGKGN